MKNRWSPEARRAWRDNRQDCLEVISEAAARVIVRPIWIVCLCCMRDTTGVEIERHLQGCADEFRLAVTDVCLRENWGGYGRTWEHWRARRLAVICILFAYLCQRSEYHGAVVWVVRGIPKGAIAVATRINTMIAGVQFKWRPHKNTLLSDFRELQRAGILDTAQFDSRKVPAWCRGNVKTDEDGRPRLDKSGRPVQWAFSYYFLLICPWPGGGEGRVVPTPRGRAIRRMRANAQPQLKADAKREHQKREREDGPTAAELGALEHRWAAQEEMQRRGEDTAEMRARVSATLRERSRGPPDRG